MNLLLKSCIHTFKKYDLLNYNNFSILASKINSSEVINTTELILKLLVFNKSNIHPKYFLSCFMIVKHPKVIISNETDIEKKICYLSDKLLSLLEKLFSLNQENYQFYKILFNLYYTIFIEQFQIWKDIDKKKIINDLCHIYFELEASKNKRHESDDELANQEFIKDIENEQKKIKTKLYKIDKEQAISYLESLEKEIHDIKKEIERLYSDIETHLHDAYWHVIEEKLSREPPDTQVIGELLTELKEMILSCKPTLENELNENIDIEFIQEMMGHKVIDDNYLFTTCSYIIQILHSLQSQNYDEELKNWRDNLFNQLEGGCKYSVFLTLFFRGMFENLQQVLREIDLYNLIKQKMNG